MILNARNIFAILLFLNIISWIKKYGEICENKIRRFQNIETKGKMKFSP